MSIKSKQWRERQRERGLCIECNQRPPEGGTRCEFHREKRRLGRKGKRTEENHRRSEKLKKWRQANPRTRGIRSPVGPHSPIKDLKVYQQRWRKRHLKEDRCIECNRRLDGESTVRCERHREMNRIACETYRANIREVSVSRGKAKRLTDWEKLDDIE